MDIRSLIINHFSLFSGNLCTGGSVCIHVHWRTAGCVCVALQRHEKHEYVDLHRQQKHCVNAGRSRGTEVFVLQLSVTSEFILVVLLCLYKIVDADQRFPQCGGLKILTEYKCNL